jgi:hypothetical protein
VLLLLLSPGLRRWRLLLLLPVWVGWSATWPLLARVSRPRAAGEEARCVNDVP